MSAKYNVLFNGNNAFNDAKKQLDETYEDNFWKRLPIEPLKIEEEEIIIPMPGQTITKVTEAQGFDKAEEKAVKAIQKHSMVIDELEKNKQIDEAYLLLGKARYYSQRFIPALEAFTFAINKYPNANLFNETRIWKAKTHVRLQNEELAIRTLDLVLKSIDLSDAEYEEAQTAMAMAYTLTDSTQQVIEHLKRSTLYFTDKEQSARNMFILGQIYREENHIDSSNIVFENLALMKKIPQKYKVHATLERAKNYNAADSTDLTIFALRGLIDDRENRPYLDELYYQAGLISQKMDSLAFAYYFYEKSVRHNTKKPVQKSLSYEQLGNLYFDDNKFEIAGAYYDSILQIKELDQNSKRVRRIIRKRESLNDVILYENIVKRNDSILHIADMPEVQQKEFFQTFIEELKAKDEAEKIKNEIAAMNSSNGITNNRNSNQTSNDSGKFYFYNVQLVGLGKQQFKNQYGNRPLADFWILSQGGGGFTTQAGKKPEELIADDSRYDVNFYLDKIPTSDKALDSIKSQRNDAYYNLGLIYKEQFKEYEMAATNFENFLKNKPIENLILPTKYHLFKTYDHFNTTASNKYKEDIVHNYSDSRYAQIIKNPKSISNLENDEYSPEKIYKSAYICYEEDDFYYSLSTVNDALEKFKGLEIEAKFELLKAFILYKTKGEKVFTDKLNFIIINYPNTEESEHAKEVLEELKNKTGKEKRKN